MVSELEELGVRTFEIFDFWAPLALLSSTSLFLSLELTISPVFSLELRFQDALPTGLGSLDVLGIPFEFPFVLDFVDAFGIDLALAASLGLAALVFVALLPLLVLLFTIGATQAPPPKMGRRAQ